MYYPFVSARVAAVLQLLLSYLLVSVGAERVLADYTAVQGTAGCNLNLGPKPLEPSIAASFIQRDHRGSRAAPKLWQHCNGTASQDMHDFSKSFAGLAPHDSDANVTRAYEPRGKTTLLVDSDICAWNNVRMSWEVAVCLAFKSRRWYRVPHLPAESDADPRLKFKDSSGNVRALNVFDYYDESSFRSIIPAMLDSDPLPGPEQLVETATTSIIQMIGPGYDHLHFLQGFQHQNSRVFNQYAAMSDFEPRSEYINLIQSAFRLRHDHICRAVSRLALHSLKPGKYLALHRRTTDFAIQYGSMVPSNKDVAEHVAPKIHGKIVLVLTDRYDQEFLDLLTSVGGAARVVCWANELKEGEEHVFDAQLDMLAAVPAEDFIASPLSTFSTGIIRWRTQAGTHAVGTPVMFTKAGYEPSFEGWPSPGSSGTWL